jgi:hypothetical protein
MLVCHVCGAEEDESTMGKHVAVLTRRCKELEAELAEARHVGAT